MFACNGSAAAVYQCCTALIKLRIRLGNQKKKKKDTHATPEKYKMMCHINNTITCPLFICPFLQVLALLNKMHENDSIEYTL